MGSLVVGRCIKAAQRRGALWLICQDFEQLDVEDDGAFGGAEGERGLAGSELTVG